MRFALLFLLASCLSAQITVPFYSQNQTSGAALSVYAAGAAGTLVSGGSSVTTPGATVAVGDYVACEFFWDNSATFSSITDALGNSQVVGSPYAVHIVSTVGNQYVAIFNITTGGSDTFTGTVTGSWNDANINCIGAKHSHGVDIAPTFGSATNAATATGPTITTNHPGIVVAFAGMDRNSATIGIGSSFTILQTDSNSQSAVATYMQATPGAIGAPASGGPWTFGASPWFVTSAFNFY